MTSYILMIKVATKKGEESISINEVGDTDMEVLEPLFIDIKSHNGYYPTGEYCRPGQPTARELYRKHQAWDIFESLVPQPPSGFACILSVQVFKEKPLEMQML